MENKKKILIFGGLGLLGISVGLGIGIIFKNKKAAVVSPVTTPTTEVQKEGLAIYEDEAGFSFEYPESLKIEDISGENDYSVLKITSPAQARQMTIKVIDTLEKEVNPTGDSRDIILAGLPAKQFQMENPRRLVTAAIDKGILFYLESPLETTGTYWNKIHNAIVSSFELTGEPKTSGGTGTSGGGETIYEEEEVVE